MSKDKSRGLFDELWPLVDDFSLKRIVGIAGSTGTGGVEKLAQIAAELIRADGVRELKRRGLLDKSPP